MTGCRRCTQLSEELFDFDKLCLAVERNDLDAMRAARNKSTPVTRFRAMARAMSRGYEAAVTLLHRWDAAANLVEDMRHAAIHGHLGIMALLHSWHREDHNEFGGAMELAMEDAARCGQLASMELLKSWDGADNLNALIHAAVGNQTAAMRLLEEWGDADFDFALARLTYELDATEDRKKAGRVLRRWQAMIAREKHHATLLDAALALHPLHLPIYPLLWLLEWTAPGPLSKLARVRLLEKIAAV